MAHNFVVLLLLVSLSSAFGAFVVDNAKTFGKGLRSLQLHGRRLSGSALSSGGRMQTGRRRLLQDSQCAWDEDQTRCRISDSAVEALLSESDGALARFLTPFATCSGAEDEDACGELGVCLWEIDAERCTYVDFSLGNEESPCVENAPGTFALGSAVNTCENAAEEDSCLAIGSCVWDEEDEVCESDFFLVYFGNSTDELTDAAVPIMEREGERAVRRFGRRFNVRADDFDWSLALDWEVPSFECPDETEDEICFFANAVIAALAPTFIYCRGQYARADAEDCDSDPLCVYDSGDDECDPSQEVQFQAGFDAVRDMADELLDGGDRQFIGTILNCTDVTEEDDCTGNCEWDEDECVASTVALFASIAEGGDTTDGVCAFFAFMADAGCEALDDEETCVENESCEYRSESGCRVDSTALAEAALAADRELGASLQDVHATCSELTNAEACEA